MFVRRRLSAALAIASVSGLLIAAGCTSTETNTGTPVGTTVDTAAVLGTPKKATGSPIKIGLIDDGKSTGIDHTPVVGAFKATVEYANEYLGGINGHVIEVDECSTNNTPSDATTCGVQMVNDKVAAVLVPVSAQDTNVFKALTGNGIPYFTYAAGSQEVITGKDTFLLVNPIATLAGPAKLAKEKGVKKAAIIIIDVPSAVAPLEAIARPIYTEAGIDLNVVPISPQTADMTPQIQQAISAGAEQFTVVGTDEFNTSAIKALQQLAFSGRIVMITPPTQTIADNVPNGLEGVAYITSATSDPADKDVQLYDAVMKKYMPDQTPVSASAWAFATVMGFVNGLNGNASAVDAASVNAALGSMPKPLPLPLGSGLTYQCGAKVVALLPNACTANVLWTELDAKGNGQKYEALDVAAYMPGA